MADTMKAAITRAFGSIQQRKVMFDIANIAHMKVNTLAELKAIVDYSDGMTVEVEDAGGAGVGRRYRFDNELIDANDNDVYVIPNNITHPAPGRWKKSEAALTTIADGSITNAMLGTACVGPTNIAASSVTHVKLAENAVENDNILNGEVISGKLAANSVGTTNLVDLCVTNAKIIADNTAVGTNNLIDHSVTIDKLDNTVVGAAAVSTTNLVNGCVTNAKLALGAVGTTNIQALAVTAAKIADNTITAGQLADNSVTVDKIADGAVTTDKILDLNVTTGKLAASSVIKSKVSYAVCPVTVDALATSKTLAADSTLKNGVILCCIPTGNQDQLIDSVALTGANSDELTVTLAAPATGANTFNVVILKA
jgi:hypothetical protein